MCLDLYGEYVCELRGIFEDLLLQYALCIMITEINQTTFPAFTAIQTSTLFPLLRPQRSSLNLKSKQQAAI